MSRIVVSGASGDLGRRVTDLLLRADPNRELTLVSRTPDKLAHHTGPGILLREGDHRKLELLEAAYQGGDVLFLISGLNLGRRVEEHRNVIAAAQKAGIRHIVYTSVGGVQRRNPALSAIDHYQSELDLRVSGLEYTFLRNALYAEIVSNILVAPGADTGRMEQATGDGYLAPVSKANVARSAAACLLDPEAHAGAVYEITGPELLNFERIAAIGTEVYGRPIEYVPITAEERLAFYDSIGIPRTYDPDMPPSPDGHMWASDELVTAEIAIAKGYQAIQSRHVEQITGHEPEPLRTVMERAKSMRYDKIDAAVS
ncbi:MULTISPECIES: NAD(P)H-binding protein [Prauserella salsuginis group]|uniref:NAD(P)H-binding protein n=1 Tax=Prauserella salsuginis TaxID=387889 RepID=A0ABW6G0T9_9PSEU|nr:MULTISPECIES: NAD(P)H-binding protein [Prauserella salsuginis group]MCR3721983.1 NAD(P)H dehydrogenase (quinone) [Prauserella flava]MCR3735989.1 NAD(P)H dehydrogenase (quinone) [Prauserella salsuginis]